MPDGVNEILIRYLANNASVIIITVDKGGTILQSNSFAALITGKNLEGLNVNDIFISFNKPFNISDYISDPPKKTLVNISNESQMPGTWYFEFYDMGSSVLAIGEANNVEIELLRKNMLELNQELNNLSRELQKSNAELKKLNVLKNQFLGIATHDLRNPLGIIMGYCDYLLEDLETSLTADQLMMLKSMMRSGEFMLRLINDLLDISTLDSGKLKLDLIKTDIAHVIRKNIEFNKVLFRKKNIDIHFDCENNIPKIEIDISKIEQVLNNLISNAVKYSQPGNSVRVSLFMNENHVTVAVADQGPGIPEAELEKLFKPFETTSVKSTAGEKSTGLGLSIVRKLIIGHQGKIWVESIVGKGSTFYFSLPLSQINKN
jgi:signal transduction histidine kinase